MPVKRKHLTRYEVGLILRAADRGIHFERDYCMIQMCFLAWPAGQRTVPVTVVGPRSGRAVGLCAQAEKQPFHPAPAV